jgi:hypothetical protein
MNTSLRKRPSDAIVLNEYDQLTTYLRSFVRGDLDLLLIIGRSGTGKSEAVKSTLGLSGSRVSGTEDHPVLYVEGHMGSFGLYRQLYAYRDRPVVIDDFDRLHTRVDCVRLLKPLCNGAPIKRITWYSNATANSPDLPESFTTKSRVVLITNDWRSVNEDVRALEDRANILDFAPSNATVHRYVGEWFEDREVYELIGGVVEAAPLLSMRHYMKGRALRRAGLTDWQQTVLQMVLGDPVLSAVARLQIIACDCESERVEIFKGLD